MTSPASHSSLTPEHEWVVRLLQGIFVHLPRRSGRGQLAQYPGDPELHVFTQERGFLGGASTVSCVTLGKSCPTLGEGGI